ncbi:MAG: ATP-binding protein [Lachnospiraceae bacterium]|nr:ATP-binding protein [Lachnospiraceae bacterium]
MLEKLQRFIDKIKSLRSLRLRIFVLLLVIGTMPSLIMREVILSSYEARAVAVQSSVVQNQMKIIANHLINYNYLQDTSSAVINAEIEELSSLYDGRVLIINDHLKAVKDTYGISEGKTVVSEEIIKCFSGKSTSNYDSVNGYIELTLPITMAVTASDDETAVTGGGTTVNGEKVVGAILISIATDNIRTTVDILSARSRNLLLIAEILIILLAFFFSAILVKPLNKVTKAISEVKEGFSDDAIQVSDYAETVHIIDAFNALLARMRILDASRQDFVSNVSHELKTPITSMKVLADSLIAQEDAPVEMYREFMEDITEEIDRENKIITDLLSLVKMDKTAASLTITEVNMNELAEVVLRRLRPIARKRDIEVTFESHREVKALVDEVKISLVISNLVENAIKYNKEHGSVNVVLDADHQYMKIVVSDTGIGIPEDSLDHIYERFYRVDKSHSREIGGTGLGLAITRSAVLMHRGFIEVESVPDTGTTFTVRIPLDCRQTQNVDKDKT